MEYTIRMGVPEMYSLWESLKAKYRNGSITQNESELYKKWGNAMKKISIDPFYPNLNTHEIEPLSRRYGLKVWQSYLENKRSKARRIFWVYGPGKGEITVIGLEQHPENSQNGAYERISLSELP